MEETAVLNDIVSTSLPTLSMVRWSKASNCSPDLADFLTF